MGRKLKNELGFNDREVAKAIRDAKGQPQAERRFTGITGLVLVTQPTGVGTFWVFYTTKAGQRRKYRIGEYGPTTLEKAKKEARRVVSSVDDGEDPAREAKSLRDAITFEQLAERFLTENPDLADTTKEVYRYTLQKNAYLYIGTTPAEAVTVDDVIAICKRIEATGARVQSERTKATIGGVYRWAVKERLVRESPTKGIGRRSPKVARVRAPTDQELAALWSAVTNPDMKLSRSMRLIIQLAVLTGQRRTEVAGARRTELHGLDTDNPMWIIPGDTNKRGKIIPGRTKNGREQHVPLSPQAAALFREALEASKGSEFVFPADMSKVRIGAAPRTEHIHGESVTRAMVRLREVAGIEDVSLHDMRRAISNWLKDQGVSREVRDLVLNHVDPSVTERHYSASARMERQVTQALRDWADHVWEVTGQAVPKSNVVPLRA